MTLKEDIDNGSAGIDCVSEVNKVFIVASACQLDVVSNNVLEYANATAIVFASIANTNHSVLLDVATNG